MVVPPIVEESLPAAVEVTNRVARTFSLAIRFLPALIRRDVYLLYLVFRILDDLVDTAQPEARRRIEEVSAWAADGGPAIGREETILEDLFRRHPAMPRHAVVDFCVGQLDELDAVPVVTEDDRRQAYCTSGENNSLCCAGVKGQLHRDLERSQRNRHGEPSRIIAHDRFISQSFDQGVGN